LVEESPVALFAIRASLEGEAAADTEAPTSWSGEAKFLQLARVNAVVVSGGWGRARAR
jgi:hypothetical protein